MTSVESVDVFFGEFKVESTNRIFQLFNCPTADNQTGDKFVRQLKWMQMNESLQINQLFIHYIILINDVKKKK